jgi:hypothetical protein
MCRTARAIVTLQGRWQAEVFSDFVEEELVRTATIHRVQTI